MSKVKRVAKHILAVSSAKGGVGKSTVAANVAVSLSRLQRRVGLLDLDVYGPSVPRLMGIADETRAKTTDKGQLEPVAALNVLCMSMGLLVARDAALVWRGPMVAKAVGQLLSDVNWGEERRQITEHSASAEPPLDYLVLDLPPGTGDAQLSLAQRADVDAALLVSQPHPLALDDTERGAAMFRQVNVRILGLVENMAYYECQSCGERTHPFTQAGDADDPRPMSNTTPTIARLPLNLDIQAVGNNNHFIQLTDEIKKQLEE